MRVRTRFTLWISLTALATAVVFSAIVFVELIKEPYKLVDKELRVVAETVFNHLDFSTPQTELELHSQYDYLVKRYWLKILDPYGRKIFASPLVQRFDIPIPKDREVFFTERRLPLTSLWIDPEDAGELDEITDDTVQFRVRVLREKRPEGQYTILIAKPLLFLDMELRELLTRLASGIGATIVFIFLISYFLAGRILKPLATINQKIREIRENSLNRRIPLGASRDELYVLSHSLNSMFDRLQHSFARQKEFIGNAAHELKSPLTILMLGHEEMLAAGPPEAIRLELEKQLDTMRRLSKLVRNLLDISRLEQDETCLREPIRLDLLIQQVLEDYREILQTLNIAVETEIEECPLLGDSEKLLRLIINLVDNAIKYNETPQGMIRIAAQRKQGRTILTIANTGPEIPAEDLPKIFEQFYRVEKSRSQAFGGSGLGLTIVRRIVELHGGSISAQSRDGWTTFTIALP